MPFSTYFPLKALLAQAKAQLPQPTASFAGQTVLITGATGGICSEACRILAALDVDTLVLGVRNLAKGDELARTLKEVASTTESAPVAETTETAAPPTEQAKRKLTVLVWKLDLLSFESVKEFAAKAAELDRLDVAVIGAAMLATARVMTADGWEESKCFERSRLRH